MSSSQVNSIIGWSAHGPGFDQVMKKALLLAERLHRPADLRLMITMNGAESDPSAEVLSKLMAALSSDENALSTMLTRAKKKGVEGSAAIHLEDDIRIPFDKDGLVVTRLSWCNRDSGVEGLCYLDFPSSRKSVHPEHAVILADSDLNKAQQKRFKKICSLFSSLKVAPNVVLIQGKSNLTHWEEHLSQSSLKRPTIDMLNSESELPSYIKKHNAALICVPGYQGLPDERLMALHNLYRSDILLF